MHGPDRPNSLSSSSVVTVKGPGSRSPSSNGTKVPRGAHSPSEPSLIALRVDSDCVAHEHKRRRSVAVESPERGESEGLNNLNRWSHSTNSSGASAEGTGKSRTNSGVALHNLVKLQLSPQRRNRTTIDYLPAVGLQQKPLVPRPSTHRRRHSPVSTSPETLRHMPSRPEFLAQTRTALPPLHTTPALTDPNDTESPSTIQTIVTPSTHSSYAHDYFAGDGGSPRSTAKNKKPVMIRTHTAPMSASNQSRVPGADAPPQDDMRRRATSERLEHTSRSSMAEDGLSRRSSRAREGREKDKKAMLSKALQKANTAVLLDNAQNFEGALVAYSDACRLLQQVMDRSSGADDKRKLEAIKVTYTTRIEELRQLESSRPSPMANKSLPARPMSDDSLRLSPTALPSSPIDASVEDTAIIETATVHRMVDVPKLSYPSRPPSRNTEASGSPSRPAPDRPRDARRAADHARLPSGEMDARQVAAPAVVKQTLSLPPIDDSVFIPRPLSPRKPHSPLLQPETEETWQLAPEHSPADPESVPRDRADSHENSVSWLDTIDESGSDCGSSVHSLSPDGLRRKHIRGISGETEAEFDAAFDAAAEAAYNEGFEPDTDAQKSRRTAQPVALPGGHTGRSLLAPRDLQAQGSYLDMDDDEEERLLDEITSDYAQGFNFDMSNKSALPRQSDSSGYSRSTWQSSQASGDRGTAATSLSTVAEDTLSVRLTQKVADTPSTASTLRPDLSPPSAPPANALPRPPSASSNRLSGVRDRRLSGQPNAKQLKIETSVKPDGRKRASTIYYSASPVQDGAEGAKPGLDRDFKFGATLEPTPSDIQHEHILASPPSLKMRSAATDVSRPMTALPTVSRRSFDDDDGPSELRSARPNLFRKNKSSLSLREPHTLLSSPEDSGPSIVTPMSSTFLPFSKKRSQDPQTSQRAHFPSFDAGLAGSVRSTGACLFDTSLATAPAPLSPRSPAWSVEPRLEPCPESFLLRPFWLMRAIGSTLTHPKGGFVTTRLFVPHEVWHTRGVKLKAVEDKTANLDLLTAALGRLGGVDTVDADAVMEELQGFEEVMERVQMTLSKKLGSEVGLHGASGLLRDPSISGTSGAGTGMGASSDATAGGAAASKSKEAKSYLGSWRKLRSKSSGTPLAPTHMSRAAPGSEREVSPMPSVPMTSYVPVERRGQRKDARNLTFEGPQKEYMGSLARLCEGAQVLDRIARQVEDPGLKHSSPTHVGLELSVRHAAEFFGFYVCRFVLADLSLLLDKFVKRGTEWVLA